MHSRVQSLIKVGCILRKSGSLLNIIKRNASIVDRMNNLKFSPELLKQMEGEQKFMTDEEMEELELYQHSEMFSRFLEQKDKETDDIRES